MVILGALVVPISINPWICVSMVPLSIVFFIIKGYFIPAARELKRLENIGNFYLIYFDSTT